MTENWIAVASAEHVRIGRAGGFMQVCHGKAAPLRRIRPGDRVAYYSPSEVYRGGDRLRALTAVGTVLDGEPYQADMGGGFLPFRRDVAWLDGRETPIGSLLGTLEFASGGRNWGGQLRFGLFKACEADLRAIARAMGAAFPD